MMTMTPLSPGLVQENECYLQTIAITGKVSSDQTGRFLNFSSRSTKYIIVLHDYDSNDILAALLKTKSPLYQLRATQALHG